MQDQLTFSTCSAHIFRAQGDTHTIVYVPMEAEQVSGLMQAAAPGTAIAALDHTDWNRDFSPWAAPAVFRGEDFSGGGPAFLASLRDEVFPAVERTLSGVRRRMIVGYSLAGLFALWAALETPLFDGAGCVSGSAWFDGFLDYAKAHPCQAARAYLSVGDKEKRTRNERMRHVEDALYTVNELLCAQGVDTLFELNPGNHFQDVDARMAKALRFLTR